jgi:formate/nitrite transporter FocA (FNT family)
MALRTIRKEKDPCLYMPCREVKRFDTRLATLIDDMIETIRKEILAGLLIGIGGFAFLSVDNKYIGAFLFSVGLISVILLGAFLYTGKVGYVRTVHNAVLMLPMCLLNMVGAALFGIVTQPLVRDQAIRSVGNKLAKEPLNVFISAAICGALIYLAV